MAIRRFRQHVSDHNWFAVAIDLAIVVVGVFLGIQASNWNQRRIDVARGRTYRAMLIDDVRDNQQNIAMRMAYFRHVRSNSAAALDALDRPLSALDEQFLINAYQASQSIPWSMKRTTYDQIMSSGAMKDLGDQSLQDQIANYYFAESVAAKFLGATTPYRDHARAIIPYPIQQRIREACPEKLGQDARGAPRPEWTESCTLGLPDGVLRPAIAQVYKASGLKEDLTLAMVDVDLKLTSLQRAKDHAAAFQRALEDAQS